MKLLPTLKSLRVLLFGHDSGPSSRVGEAALFRDNVRPGSMADVYDQKPLGLSTEPQVQPGTVPGKFVEDAAETSTLALDDGRRESVEYPSSKQWWERFPQRGPVLLEGSSSLKKAEPKLPVVAGAEGAIVWSAGEWVATKPTSDHTQEFPELSKFASPSVVPQELQTQPADRGTFFTPAIESKALGKTARFGLYLPPGFDPASDTKYPMLLLLPGKGGELHQWTSVGNLIPTSNTMMAGDYQKMIVVIADNTNSFWYDYDSNGSPTFGATGEKKLRSPRNFEGHVMDELLSEVVGKYKGDPTKLSIHGISRGGAGALQLASRHEGRFVSASSQSGLLMLEHGDNRLGGIAAREEIKQHFGGPNDPVWGNFMPYDLLRVGKLDGSSTKFYVEVGTNDVNMLGGNLDYIALAKARGVPVEHAVFGEHQRETAAGDDKPPSSVGHSWDMWGKTLSLTIAFHQRAHGGKAFKPKVDSALVLRDNELLAEREVSRAKRREAVATGLAAAKADLSNITEYLSQRELPTPRPFEPSFIRTQRSLKADPSPLTERLARHISETEAGVADLPLFAQEQRLAELQRLIAASSTDSKDLRQHLVGEPMGTISTNRSGISALPEPVRADVNRLIELMPEARDALAQLANQYPELLSRVDRLAHHDGTFANHLLTFAKNDLADAADRAGFVEYIERIAHGEWDWRRGGYSHTVNSATAIAWCSI